mmetsp:Transcript_43670/g.105333  ORF Transcript_43670/g.105333 Transcript_43670/m.105333 type:complete len:100 (+) Transcript_43670:1490-1789(+)
MHSSITHGPGSFETSALDTEKLFALWGHVMHIEAVSPCILKMIDFLHGNKFCHGLVWQCWQAPHNIESNGDPGWSFTLWNLYRDQVGTAGHGVGMNPLE